jgi:hypothetical protein
LASWHQYERSFETLKLESLEASSSVKDRIGKSMIEETSRKENGFLVWLCSDVKEIVQFQLSWCDLFAFLFKYNYY